MASKNRHRGGIEIGSDSFLDVLANMVGIMIILIVITGLRASELPPPTTSIEAPIQQDSDLEQIPLASNETKESPAEREPLPPEVSLEVPGHVEEEWELLQAEIDELENSIRSTLKEENEGEETSEAQTQESADRIQKFQALLADKRKLLRTQKDRIAKAHEKLSLKQLEIENLMNVEQPTKKLDHQVTPISRQVSGEELHFHVKEGKVALVPISELIKQVMREAERRREWFARSRIHQGEVGPSGGFRMEYMLERDDAYGVGGGTVIRVGVSAFQIHPDNDLEAESPEQALKRGSKFQLQLKMAETGATFTFWVYPDSFETYRKLQEAVRDAGFRVAARPLPEGVPISGSPSGTKSAAQ